MLSAGFLKPLPFVGLAPYSEENGICMLSFLTAAGINDHSQARTQQKLSAPQFWTLEPKGGHWQVGS